MKEHIVARVDELPEGERRIVRIGQLEVGIFHLRGAYYAVPNVCAHQFGPLCEGRLTGTLESRAETGWKLAWVKEGEILTCPWHALEYDIATGRCLAYPKVRLRHFPIRVEGEHLVLSV